MPETQIVDLRRSPHFLVVVNKIGRWDQTEVQIRPYHPDQDKPEFGYWMAACEYFLHKTAQRSSAGYEKALELLIKGAMTWRDKEGDDA